MSEVLLRTGRADDIDAVLALWVAADSPESTGADRDGVRNLVRRDPDALIVAERDGRIVGTIVAGWDGWRAALYRLAVHPDERRQGLGLLLVDAAMHRLRALGARRCAAIVLRDNGPALGFWSATEFAAQEEVVRYALDL